MSLRKRELAFEAERPGVNAGDWWHLVFDPDIPGIYVEHTWSRTNAVADRSAPSGMERYGINDFLVLAQDGPARSALFVALGEMFPERPQAEHQQVALDGSGSGVRANL